MSVRVGVFTNGFPGLQLGNIGMLGKAISAIDFHAALEIEAVKAELASLRTVLEANDLLLDAVVFGLEGESYASPAEARGSVGFAAPGAERRTARVHYASELACRVSEILPGELFVRGRCTVKGHFGAFDRNNAGEYKHFVHTLRDLADQTLDPLGILMLAETGCEPADAVIDLVDELGSPNYACNWDTANLALWGAEVDNLGYARKLAKRNLLRGIHLKGGLPPSKPGGWGTEIDPSAELIDAAVTICRDSAFFDGAFIVERELFLGSQRETQEEKAAGLLRTLWLVQAALGR